MKLRSGKIIKRVQYKLPEKLDNELETNLEKFKTLFSSNLQHAKELLKIISKCKSKDDRVDVRLKVAEVYDENEPETAPLTRAAGDFMRLVVGNSSFYKENHIEPKYHDIIEARIKNFDLETPLSGNIEEKSCNDFYQET